MEESIRKYLETGAGGNGLSQRSKSPEAEAYVFRDERVLTACGQLKKQQEGTAATATWLQLLERESL